ncbi:MAG: BREX system Lon protease-like protein BrxL [Aquidulcibacter sp.]|jgi:ATP-dependent Lon protease|uniref:BREX system Lon protease-like protein BrxL n=1 Tax=Aquidulcibacter sp. TaxID=2052990 RepID=UPI0022C7C5AF|nr:BREX system Lon protease-like protein BrxL [Aquidulcibacter sp.]MCE2892631.1 BREX system Lon protease-like protein BrxL [Hyphomonadaceae bacterium]MCZ8207530.1 BREX system Lon protease-like protein BrxL [Aquidulcibacter sp.]
MTTLDDKINQHFPGLVVRKDLVKAVKGNAIVPSYVLEYLLGQYCATNDEASIETGIATVQDILRKHYVHRNEAGLIKSNIREKGRWKIIDRVSATLNDKDNVYEASFANLGLNKIIISTETIKSHPKLLVGGVWCICDIEYLHDGESTDVPWNLASLKPIQLSKFDYEGYLAARQAFTTDEWIDLLLQTVGFQPEHFGRRSKLLQLMRLIPFVERNYNLIELGPKGTGKSHIFSEFSPHGILISGGEVSVPKLFVNNTSGKIGLVGYWDVVAFDEFAGRQKKVDKALVDIMKNYMANKSFSRGIETLGAEASMVFVGNTAHTVPYMLRHSDLFEELPDKYYDSAFIDRIHAYIPGWEVEVIRSEMFSNSYGFVVDYLAEILRHLRNQDLSGVYKPHFTVSSDISTRDRDGVNKTFSGLMKLLFPGGGASEDEIAEMLSLALECRKRVKDQLARIDSTYPETDFSYQRQSGQKVQVTTLEEREYPDLYNSRRKDAEAPASPLEVLNGAGASAPSLALSADGPQPGHRTFEENQKGISFERLFWPYLKGASKITLTDPYIRMFHQLRNLMELVEMIAVNKPAEQEVDFHLVTAPDEFGKERQEAQLVSIRDAVLGAGIRLTWDMEQSGELHARHIVADSGWRISLDRGLDIFQKFDTRDAFTLVSRQQIFRPVKRFELIYIGTNDLAT